jgi:hypothetical protein
MKAMTLEQTKAEGPRNHILRRLCEEGITEPEGIWEMLESRGIHVTPGVIYQAISNHNNQQKTTNLDRSARALPDEEKGVTWKDVEMVALIAEKAGGFQQLVRVLSTMQRVLGNSHRGRACPTYAKGRNRASAVSPETAPTAKRTTSGRARR